MHSEWTVLDGFDWTPELVAGVDADLAAGVEENHFHEAVPYIQFGLKTLARARRDPSADEKVLVALAREFFPRDADRATPELVARLRTAGREHVDEAIDDCVRFGLRVLARARREDWDPPPARRSLFRRLFDR